MKHLKLSTKLYLLCAAQLVLAVLVGLLGLYSVRKNHAGLKAVYEQVERLQQLKSASDAYAVTIIDAVNKANAGLLSAEDTRKLLELAVQEGQKSWKAFTANKLTQEQTQLAKQTEQLIATADQRISEVRQFLADKSGNLQGALAHFVGPLYASVDPVTSKIQELVNLNLEVTNTEYELSSQRYRLLLTLLTALLLGGGAASGFLGWWIARSIAKPITEVAAKLQASAEHTASAAAQVSSSSQSLAQGASEQAASLEETSASLEELTAMTQRNAANAQQARQLATQTRQAVEAGQHDMSQLARAMDDIQQASSEISKIIKTIDEIAFQTNLLALNAAVEAARAGEAGMGFAVVADEVRALAQRAAAAARETAEKIENSVAKSQTGAQMSQRVAQHLQDILAKARQVDELVAEIAAASQEQSQGISQINAAVSQMDKVTQANAAAAEQSAATAQELNAQAARLQQAVLELQALVGSTQTQFQGTAEESGSEVPAELPAQPRLRELRVTPGPVGESWVGRGSNGAREMQSQLTKAMAAHSAWKRRLEEAIQTGKSDITPERASVDDQCEFGKWLYSLPRQLRESATWQKVRTLHADFHREAGRVLQLALTGRKTEAKAAMSHGGAFTLRSAELIRALQQWKSSSSDSTKGVRATPMPSAVGSGPATILKASEANGDFVDDPIPMPPPEEHPKPRF